MYKLIALDMDGTLLNDSKIITENTKLALKAAQEQGVKIVLASGRPLYGLKKYLKELDLLKENEYVLSYNGCLVQENSTGNIIHEVALKGFDLKYIYDLSRTLKVNLHAFSPTKGLITPKVSKYTKFESELNDMDINIIDVNAIDDDEDIVKVMMVDEPEILERAISNLPSEVYSKYTVVKSAPCFLEFINKDSDKGKGLEALAKHLDIDKADVIAVGDAQNDLAMIEYAGLGVAMGNASQEIKDSADYVTDSNEQDGISNLIKKYIL